MFSILFISDQGTQTEILQITEPLEKKEVVVEIEKATSEANGKSNGHYYHTIERESSVLRKEDQQQHKLRKSASFSSSSNSSIKGLVDGSSNTSSGSSLSLRSSPLRSSCRTLKSGKINTFQKWETTVESVSYVTTKTVAINEYPSDKRSRSITPITIAKAIIEPISTSTTANGLKESPVKLTNGCNVTNGTAEKGKCICS